MSVWLEIPRRRPDGRHKASGRTTVQLTFQNFAEIQIEARLDDVRMVALWRVEEC
jgi:hypothetical protein